MTRVAIAPPEECPSGRTPIFIPNPLLCAITRYYPLIRAKSFKFSGLFWSILELFSARNPQSASHSRHTSPAGPRRPPFNGPLTTRPETIFRANHQPIQLSKNTKTDDSPPSPGGPRCAKRTSPFGPLTRGGLGKPLGWGEGERVSKHNSPLSPPPDAIRPAPANLAHSITLSRNNYTICYFPLNPRLPPSRPCPP